MARPIGDIAKTAMSDLPDQHLRAPVRRLKGWVHEFSTIPTDKFRDRAGVAANLATTLNYVSCGHADWPLFIHGGPGSGKTCAVLCIIDTLGGWYTTLTRFHALLCEALKDKVAYEGPAPAIATPRAIWDDLSKVNLFVLDDLGLRPPTAPMYETMNDILNLREGKPIIVTSNHDLQALRRIFDDRVADRLGMGTIYQTTGNRRTVGTTHTGKMLEEA